MHYDIRYNLTNTKRADAKAIKDIKQWLGSTKKFNKVADSMLSLLQDNLISSSPLPKTIKQFRFYLAFAGIQGYPVMAMFRYLLSSRIKLVNCYGQEIATGKTYAIMRHVRKLVANGNGTLTDYTTEII